MRLEVLSDAMSQEKYKLHVLKMCMYIRYVCILDTSISLSIHIAISEWNKHKTYKPLQVSN